MDKARGKKAIPLIVLPDGDGMKDQCRLARLVLHEQERNQAGNGDNNISCCEHFSIYHNDEFLLISVEISIKPSLAEKLEPLYNDLSIKTYLGSCFLMLNCCISTAKSLSSRRNNY